MTQKKVNNKIKKILLVGYPSSGLISTFATSYVVHTLKMNQIGEIDHPDLLPTLFVENGEILEPIRIYNKENLFVILSDIPFEPDVASDFAEMVLNYCKGQKIDMIVMVSGLEALNNPPASPKVYGLITHRSLEKMLYENQISKFLAGSIYGTEAKLISRFRKSGMPTLVIYAECHPFFPDPSAAINAITSLSKVLKIKLDTQDIKNKMETLRIQHRNLMQETLNALKQQQEKHPKPKVPQIYK